MRRLSKSAFTETSVADIFHTLPDRDACEGDAGHEEANVMRAFASKKGSLCGLNGLIRLRESDKMNDEGFMVKVSPRLHGSYPSHINHVMELVQY